LVLEASAPLLVLQGLASNLQVGVVSLLDPLGVFRGLYENIFLTPIVDAQLLKEEEEDGVQRVTTDFTISRLCVARVHKYGKPLICFWKKPLQVQIRLTNAQNEYA